jgi:hypothetical protein
VKVAIFNLLGVEVLSRTLCCGKVHDLSLESQAPGIYLVKVVKDGKMRVVKVVRE